MARNKVLWAVVGVLAVCCITGAIVLFWQARSIPPISEQLPENYSHLYVQIAYPLPKSRWPLNSFIPIQVRAQGADRIKQVELFINDVALDPQTASADSFSSAWMWQPGVTGDFILIAKAVTESGAVSLSEPVRITAIEAGFTVSPIKAQGGETLESIAQAEGIPLEALQQSNPRIDPILPLQPHELIFIPNLPAPVINAQIIPALPITISPVEDVVTPVPGEAPPSEENIITPVPDNPPSSEEPSSPGTNLLDDFNFMIEFNNPGGNQDENGPKYIPKAPVLEGDFKGCTVHLGIGGWWYDPHDPLVVKMQEDGFFVYRSRNGGPMERIHTIPPIHDFKDDANTKFYDPGQYGTLVYYVSAFNILGEAASNPVTLALDSGLCPAPARAGANKISMENGDLVLPFKMDTAYLYLQINGSRGVRIPEGNRTFLPSSGIRFNIYDYLSTRIDTIQAPDLELHMEVWGWQGGMLKYAGDFDTTIHRPVLTICSVEGIGSCTNGSGKWVGSLNLPQDKPLNELKYEMHWQVTGLTTAETIYFQVSAAPFTGDAIDATSHLLYAYRMWAKGTEGVFELPLGHILYPDPPNTDLRWGPPGIPSHVQDFTSNGFLGEPVGKPFTLYLRARPGLVMTGYNRTSNIVPLTYETSMPPSDMPPLASVYPSIYDVEILEDTYKPPDFYVPGMWGCVLVDEDPTGKLTGQTVCPGKPVQESDCPEDFWGEFVCLAKGTLFVVDYTYDTVFHIFEMLRELCSTAISTIIPFCDDSPDCKAAVSSAVDEAWEKGTGIPADMPKSDELISDSVAKMIVESAIEAEKQYSELDKSYVEQFCDTVVDCEKEISDQVDIQLKQARSLMSQPACTNAYEAALRGIEPTCLDPVLVVHAAPGSANFPAAVLIRVTRKTTSDSIWAIEADKDKHQIFVTVEAEKYNQASQTTSTGPLYGTAQVSIPWLEPGESIVLPATLKLLGEDAYGTLRLYYDGTSHMKAVETCYSSDSSWDWVPCKEGGLDTWDFKNPPSMADWVEVAP
ncbi:MAG: LysM domain-containing protein [Chloroflexi bacterium]|nr:MAG: LysM domain-containing protein [Chloroflexota bacterium]